MAALLYVASPQQLHVDLGRQLKFPQHNVLASLQIDVLITSEPSKQLIILKFTWEQHRRRKREETHAATGERLKVSEAVRCTVNL